MLQLLLIRVPAALLIPHFTVKFLRHGRGGQRNLRGIARAEDFFNNLKDILRQMEVAVRWIGGKQAELVDGTGGIFAPRVVEYCARQYAPPRAATTASPFFWCAACNFCSAYGIRAGSKKEWSMWMVSSFTPVRR